jgi:hypothetical protein
MVYQPRINFTHGIIPGPCYTLVREISIGILLGSRLLTGQTKFGWSAIWSQGRSHRAIGFVSRRPDFSPSHGRQSGPVNLLILWDHFRACGSHSGNLDDDLAIFGPNEVWRVFGF